MKNSGSDDLYFEFNLVKILTVLPLIFIACIYLPLVLTHSEIVFYSTISIIVLQAIAWFLWVWIMIIITAFIYRSVAGFAISALVCLFNAVALIVLLLINHAHPEDIGYLAAALRDYSEIIYPVVFGLIVAYYYWINRYFQNPNC